mmetsp:Transcript_36943/g.80491  ORF Transcript_36943/g.80491 Transcript_36943/m.80491 type:complete len:240 (-) Transcript_36943:299-1018(-)
MHPHPHCLLLRADADADADALHTAYAAHPPCGRRLVSRGRPSQRPARLATVGPAARPEPSMGARTTNRRLVVTHQRRGRPRDAQAELLMLSRSLAIFALRTSLREALWLSAAEAVPSAFFTPLRRTSFSQGESRILYRANTAPPMPVMRMKDTPRTRKGPPSCTVSSSSSEAFASGDSSGAAAGPLVGSAVLKPSPAPLVGSTVLESSPPAIASRRSGVTVACIPGGVREPYSRSRNLC